MARIGELLISEGHLTREGLEEALDWQVLYGGRLGTNLLELKLVKEEDLARTLGKQRGAEVTWGEITIDPSVVGVIPKHIADRQEIIPWKLDKRRLKILLCDINVQELDQLSYKIGRTCVPVIAPEFRIFQLLRAHFGATRQMRALDFGVVPEEGRDQRKRTKARESGQLVEEAPELIDEAAFNDIYAKVVQGRTSSPPQPAVPGVQNFPVQAASEVVAQTPPPKPASSWQHGPARPAGPPVMMPVAAPEPAVAPHMVPQPAVPQAVAEMPIEALPEDAILEELPADAILGEGEQPLEPVSWDDIPATPPGPVRDETPLEFKQALQALEGVTDRDEIAHLVLRASRSKAARALLLQVQGGVAVGWDGLGEGLENGAATQVALPLRVESAFSLVARTRSHYMGPLQKTPANIRFLATLGKKVPLSSLIFPILHRGRVSHMLYLDNGHKQQAPTDVGEMLILSQRIGQTVEALVERKRKAARG